MKGFDMSHWLRLLVLLLACNSALAGKPPEIVGGCEGEGCDCYDGYRDAMGTGKAMDFPIPTVRPLELYAQADKSSRLLGSFKPGIKATPHVQFNVVHDRGAYVVTAIQGKVKGLRRGDRLDTFFRLGEGELMLRKRGNWVSFDGEKVTLKRIRETKLEPWTEVTVGKQRGFAPGNPFQGCLE